MISWSATLGAYIYRGEQAVLNQHIFKVLPFVNKSFLYYLVSHQINMLKAQVHGTGMQHITKKKFDETAVLLPPLNEQHSIVAKLEELLTNLDAGVEALKMVQAQIGQYRQAVLKYAFEGKLTAEWREAHKDELEPASVLLDRIREEHKKKLGGKYKEVPAVDTSDLSELPDGWEWARIGGISEVKGGKRLPKGHEYSDVRTDFPYIRVTDFDDMSINSPAVRFLKPETQELICRYTISENDLYISIAGTIGKVGLISHELDGANLTENAAKITSIEGTDKRYLAFFLNSYFAQEQIKRLIISSNQPKLALFRIEQIIIALPPVDEQREIVNEVERRLSIADGIQRTIETSIRQSDRLRQSILKKAFEGKLVPQDPNDEPAQKLLERIKEERAAQSVEAKNTRGRKKS